MASVIQENLALNPRDRSVYHQAQVIWRLPKLIYSRDALAAMRA